MPGENDPGGENIARDKNIIDVVFDLAEQWDLVSRFIVFLYSCKMYIMC
jgi:hypothetical protein